MNCNEFTLRMHQRLDDRRSLEGDNQLRRHAHGCESCRAQLKAWRQIDSIMPAAMRDTTRSAIRKNYLRTVPALASLAAAILFAMILVPHGENSIAPTVDSATTENDETVLAQAAGQMDPALWWRHVQDRDWVEQTMPTVRSVREGVAPIGRSLMRAVTILTIGGREQTS